MTILKMVFKINTVLSIIPDIFYIPFSISLVILFYRYTDILLFNVANSSEDKALIFSILVLSIIPLVSSVTFLSSILDDVSRADYIEFSRAKGLSNVELYFKHILRNLFASYLINFKHIIWITLSSLLLLERIFNMHGLSSFIFDYGSPEVLFVTFILIYVPVSLAIFMSHKVLFTITGVRRVIMKKFYTLLTLLILPALVGVVYFDLLNITPKPMNFLYNSNGDIMKSSPFAPSFKALFGVDAASKNMLFEVLSGYRITLLIIIVISSLSVLLFNCNGNLFSI